MKKSTKCQGDRSACFCVGNERQGSASGKVTCDAESGKLGAHQVEGAGGWHQVLGRKMDDKGIFIVLGDQNLG